LAALDPAGHHLAWDDLSTLLDPEDIAVLVGQVDRPPETWATVRVVPCVQMVDVSVDCSVSGLPEAEVLGPEDVAQMLELVQQTRPGPFATRTLELGTYLGLRRGGVLVAMAGQRLHPPGWTEISAVCTHPGHRGQGLASGLVRRLCGEIRHRGERPFLHAAVSNLAAIELYETLGFAVRREITFEAFRPLTRTGP
jgi:ribosomal protein S18 acetylase RimI-like enzyme